MCRFSFKVSVCLFFVKQRSGLRQANIEIISKKYKYASTKSLSLSDNVDNLL